MYLTILCARTASASELRTAGYMKTQTVVFYSGEIDECGGVSPPFTQTRKLFTLYIVFIIKLPMGRNVSPKYRSAKKQETEFPLIPQRVLEKVSSSFPESFLLLADGNFQETQWKLT